MKVCFSGTFNVLHKGHKKLIDKAFQLAGKKGTVYIGVTSNEMVKEKKYVKPLSIRINKLKDYLISKNYENRAIIVEIFDKYGPIIDGEYDIIIVSPETYKNAEEINTKRKDKGIKPLKIIKMPYVLTEDKKPISSTRILNKEIDENGKVLAK